MASKKTAKKTSVRKSAKKTAARKPAAASKARSASKARRTSKAAAAQGAATRKSPSKAEIVRELKKGEGIFAAADSLGISRRAFRTLCDRLGIDREAWRRDTRNQRPRATPGKPSKLGRKVATWRKAQGLTRNEAAEKCKLRPIQIYHLETGHVVGERYIPQIAKGMRMSQAALESLV